MSGVIYGSGDIRSKTGRSLNGFMILDKFGGDYGVQYKGSPGWGAVTPEKLREAADAIEAHRDKKVSWTFEDNWGDQYTVTVNTGSCSASVSGEGFVHIKQSKLAELIERALNEQKASSV